MIFFDLVSLPVDLFAWGGLRQEVGLGIFKVLREFGTGVSAHLRPEHCSLGKLVRRFEDGRIESGLWLLFVTRHLDEPGRLNLDCLNFGKGRRLLDHRWHGAFADHPRLVVKLFDESPGRMQVQPPRLRLLQD